MGHRLEHPVWRATVCLVVLAIGSIAVMGLWHDLQGWQSGALDAAFHALFTGAVFATPIYLAALLHVLWFLARRIGRDGRRWRVAGAVWSVVGLLALWGVATWSGVLQEVYNGDAYKRITPDDYLYWIGPRGESGPEVLSFLDRPDAFDRYGWIAMTVIEASSLVALAFMCAAAIRWMNGWAPRWSVLALPSTLIFGLWIYTWALAPWAFILDYDVFVGDRVLGSIIKSGFVPFGLDQTGGVVVFGYLVSIVVMIWIWPPVGQGVDRADPPDDRPPRA